MEVTPERGSQGGQYPSVTLLPPLTCWGAPQCPQKPSGHRSHAIRGDQPPGAPELWAQKAENGQRPGGVAGRLAWTPRGSLQAGQLGATQQTVSHQESPL